MGVSADVVVCTIAVYHVFCRWVWLEGGANMDLEASLGVGGFGYPVSCLGIT